MPRAPRGPRPIAHIPARAHANPSRLIQGLQPDAYAPELEEPQCAGQTRTEVLLRLVERQARRAVPRSRGQI